MEVITDINWKYEAALVLCRYLFKKNDPNRMVSHLSKFRVEKDEVNTLYSKYDLFLSNVFSELDKINISDEIDSAILNFFNPCFSFVSIAEYYYHYIGMTNNFDINKFFSYLINEACDVINMYSISDYQQLITIVNQLDFSDNEKLLLISFYGCYEKYINEINRYIDKTINILINNFDILKRDYENCIKLLDEKYIANIANDCQVELNNLVLYINILEYSLWNYNELDKNYIGINYMYSSIKMINDDRKKNEELVINAFKSLGDKTRYKLIKTLSSKGKMYVQEMAKVLSITPATVLHHIDILKNVGIINTCVDLTDKKRIYYELNNNMLKLLRVNISDLIGG